LPLLLVLQLALATMPGLAQVAGHGPATPPLDSLVLRLAAMTAVTGFEEAVADSVIAALPGAKRDAAGNVIWTRGSGEPVRVAACALDEPGHVVGGITPDGYLTLRRAGRSPVGTAPERFLEGQRVTVLGAMGAVQGVVGVRSTHLQRGRASPVTGGETLSLEEAYVDVGASSADEVASLGIRVPAPVARYKTPQRYGVDLVAAPAAASRAACAALLGAVLDVERTGAARGTAVAAFTSRRHLDWDGAAFAIGGAARPQIAAQRSPAAVEAVLVGDPAPDDSLGLGVVLRGPGNSDAFPGAGEVHLWTLPARYPSSPVETVSLRDVEALSIGLAEFLSGASDSAAKGRDRAEPPAPSRETSRPPTPETGALDEPAAGSDRAGDRFDRARLILERLEGVSRTDQAGERDRLNRAQTVLRELLVTYAVSGAEEPMRQAVRRLLPRWAEPITDERGNLRLRVGSGPPLVVFIAHLDEVGFAVTRIRDDGLLEVEARGGFYARLFEGEPALVHAASGPVPAVFAARAAAAPGGTPGDAAAPEPTAGPPVVDPGTRSRPESEALGIRPADTVTMPKELSSLAGTRVTGRGMDDRVGCAAQILALRALDPGKLPHAVEFIFSVEEEIGLNGAEWAARDLAADRPARVHAIDTFVSSDAPLERRTFAYAPLGRGAVIRAVDDSAVAPPALVDSLSVLARGLGIPLQVGVTGGGNDGSAFTRYGVPDVAIGWPLRYSHSPAEVVDLRDVLALADVIRAVAQHW
jgi:putative aminopeptidase FrvX